jgi:hypothetical protein
VVHRVFIASPSDVRPSREEARHIIHLWNERNWERERVMLVPLLWENMTPELGSRPQEIINRNLLALATILVCIFWSRIGTPTGRAKSGTLEEIKRFLKKSEAGKAAMVFFSTEPLPHDHDRYQWRELQRFKRLIKARGVIGEYKSFADLQDKLLRGLTDKVSELKRSDRSSET